MFSFRLAIATTLGVSLAVGGCSGTSPSAPDAASARGTARDTAPTASNAAQPPFNLEAVLHGEGFGLVKFRQEKDPAHNIVNLDVSVRGLQPNTTYSLQRAVDTILDGACTGTNWLTLGQGATPAVIQTDDSGSGGAQLWRDLSSVPVGSAFDIYFRVVTMGTTDVVLQSDCYRFVVRD